MKTILLFLALAFCVSSTFADPPTTPAPSFDALHIAPRPAATPAPLTLTQKQAQYKARVKAMSSAMFLQLVQNYTQLLAFTQADDSAKGGLSPAQKAAALTADEKTELLTNAWLIANLLNGIAPGAVPNPPTP